VRRMDEPDRGDIARAYLANARECADLVNTVEMPRIGQSNAERVREIAIMNALLAIAVMQVPDEPGMRLA
jgi:hypothetical protein